MLFKVGTPISVACIQKVFMVDISRRRGMINGFAPDVMKTSGGRVFLVIPVLLAVLCVTCTFTLLDANPDILFRLVGQESDL